jgi:hypothetical protein
MVLVAKQGCKQQSPDHCTQMATWTLQKQCSNRKTTDAHHTPAGLGPPACRPTRAPTQTQYQKDAEALAMIIPHNSTKPNTRLTQCLGLTRLLHGTTKPPAGGGYLQQRQLPAAGNTNSQTRKNTTCCIIQRWSAHATSLAAVHTPNTHFSPVGVLNWASAMQFSTLLQHHQSPSHMTLLKTQAAADMWVKALIQHQSAQAWN